MIPEIDALLGVEMYDQVDKGEIVRIGSAVLRSTKFGYILMSKIAPSWNKESNPLPPTASSCCCLSVDRIDQRLKMFWESEDVSVPKFESIKVETCNAHFEKTFQRNEDDKFIVRLPFKRDLATVISNDDRVLSYQKRVEKRLTEIVAKLYDELMQEYIDLGHMTLVPNNDKLNRYFIPHHAVMKPSSTTTKLRVTFHTSFGEPSLNDTLMVGPVVQPELFHILLRFRTYRSMSRAT